MPAETNPVLWFAFSAKKADEIANCSGIPDFHSRLGDVEVWTTIRCDDSPVRATVALIALNVQMRTGRGETQISFPRFALAASKLVEEIRHGWGYDQTGQWHGDDSEVVPFRAEDTGDHLALARGVVGPSFLRSFLATDCSSCCSPVVEEMRFGWSTSD